MKKESFITKLIENLDAIIAGAVFLFMLGFTAVAVVMRYVVGRPFTITEEVQLWCMVWVVFFGVIVVSRQASQIAIDIVIEALPGKIGKVMETIIQIATLFLLAYVGWQSWLYTNHMIVHDRKTTMLLVPYGIIYGVVPLAFVFMFAYTVRDIIKLWKKPEESEKGTEVTDGE